MKILLLSLIVTFSVISLTYSQTAEEFYRQGIEKQDAGYYIEAINLFTKAINLNPKYWDAYFNRGNCYFDLKEYSGAILNYNKATELHPYDSDAFYNRGLSYYELKEYSKAISDFTKELETNINNIDAYYIRGRAYHESHDYRKAISDYSKVLETKPNDADSYFNRGSAYYELGYYSYAIYDLTKTIELRENDAEAYYNRGLSYYYSKDNIEACDNFKTAYSLGYSRAMECIDKYCHNSEYNITTEEERAYRYFKEGFEKLQRGIFELAINLFTKAIENNPNYADAYYWRGCSYFYSNNRYEACKNWKIASLLGSEVARKSVYVECE